MIIPLRCHTCMTMPSSEERLHIMMSRTEYQTHPYCQFPRNMRALWGSHFLFGFFNSDLHVLHWKSMYGKKCHKRSNVHRAKTIMRWLRPSCMLPIETAAHYQTHCWVIFLCCLLSGWHFIWSIQRNQYKWQGSSSWANNYIVLWASWLQWARYWMFWLFWCLPYLDWMNVFCVLIKLSNMITLE